MIEMLCPKCGHQLRIPDHFAGQRGGCKYCKTAFVVPAETPGLSPTVLATPLEALRVDGPRPPVPIERPPERLGIGFWILAVLIPPAGLLWGVLLPRDHSQKNTAILASVLLFAVGMLAIVPITLGSMSVKGVLEDPAAQAMLLEGESSAPVVSASDEAAIRECVERLTAAMDKGDAEALRQIVAKDCAMAEFGLFWDLMTPEVLESTASMGMVSKVESVEIVALSDGIARVKATVTGTYPQGWTKAIADYALRKDRGGWRVAAFVGIDQQAGIGEPSKLTGSDRPADESLFAHLTRYPGVTFEPAEPSDMLLPAGVQEELAVCATGVTQDTAEKVRDFYMKDLETNGWDNVNFGSGSRSKSDGSSETFQSVPGTRPGPGGTHKLELVVAIVETSAGRRIAIAMGPSDSGEGSISSRDPALTFMPGKPDADAMVALENMGDFIAPYPGAQFGSIDAVSAPRPLVASELATCAAGTVPDSVDAVAAFYQADLENQGWQKIQTSRETLELPGVGWVGARCFSARLPLPGAEYELRNKITVYAYGEGTGIIICIGPS